jgi:hypothetical protein
VFPHFDFYNRFPISHQRLRKEFRHRTSNDIHMRLKLEVSGIEKFDDRVGLSRWKASALAGMK